MVIDLFERQNSDLHSANIDSHSFLSEKSDVWSEIIADIIQVRRLDAIIILQLYILFFVVIVVFVIINKHPASVAINESKEV